MKRHLSLLGGAACLTLAIGCGPEIDNSPRPAPPAASPDAAENAPPTTTTPEASGQPTPSEANAAAQPAAEPATNMEKAEGGVGAKGQGYGGGIVTEPVHQYFLVQDRIVFEQQLPHTLDLYKASHNGKGPATHEKFMKEIIADNSISLPELPPGDKYLYDPKTEELMVQHPAR